MFHNPGPNEQQKDADQTVMYVQKPDGKIEYPSIRDVVDAEDDDDKEPEGNMLSALKK